MALIYRRDRQRDAGFLNEDDTKAVILPKQLRGRSTTHIPFWDRLVTHMRERGYVVETKDVRQRWTGARLRGTAPCRACYAGGKKGSHNGRASPRTEQGYGSGRRH